MNKPPQLARLAALTTVLTAATTSADPLHDQDNGPISGIYNFVESTEGADLLPQGAFGWSLSTITSSHSTDSERDDESLVYDGETTRAELRFRYAPSDRVELGIELPWVWHSPGELDGFIDSWHSFFALPTGNREERPNDLLQFSYTDASGERLDYRESSNGIGDIRLQAAYRVGNSPGHARAFRFGATMPTGDSENLHGSGAPTLSVGYAGDVDNIGGNPRWSTYYRFHATWIGEPDLLSDVYKSWVFHAAGGLGLQAAKWLELRAQLAARSATHNVEIDALGQSSFILTLGGNIHLGPNYDLMLAVGEDIKVSSSPDVSFQLALRYRPDRQRRGN